MRYFIAFALLISSMTFADVSDFDDNPLAPESFYNGADEAGGFTSRGVSYNNSYTPAFGSWSGFAYSNTSDTTTPGFLNQYSAITGAGAGGQGNYGVAFYDFFTPVIPELTFSTPSIPESIQITNTTYAALSMRDGDSFAKQFGGMSGDDPDYFKLILEGLDASGNSTGTVDFFLADYRFADNSLDYIVDQWQSVDVSSLGAVSSIQFTLETTDIGNYGPATPFYFAIDNVEFNAVPEPSSALLIVLGFVTLIGTRRR
ncbi:MAG: DUF4465 domain-containing protein [Planctomycetota bacterium]